MEKQRELHRAELPNTTKQFWFVSSLDTIFSIVSKWFDRFKIHFEFICIISQQLKQQRDKLKQYQKRIELSLEKDRELAKKCLASGRKE